MIYDKNYFNMHVDIDLNNCWNWTGQTDKRGYGIISIGSNYKGRTIQKKRLAHRLAFIAKYPDIDITSKCVCHKCDNPPCCNPDHLFVGTRKDNNIDKQQKGRAVTTQRKLTADQVRDVRLLTIPAAVKKYNISKSTASYIKRKITYSTVI